MFPSVEELESHIRDGLQENRFYSKQSWVVPAVARDGARIHDVVIVGAGQNGLALAYALKSRGIRRLVVVDAQEKDRPGPWSSFARMPSLRTPKSIPGPDCGNPLLRFKTWFCSAYSPSEYDGFEFIPLKYWQEYLGWYRSVLGIDTVNGTTVTGIRWDTEENCLRIDTRSADGGTDVLLARKMCLATGMTGAGRWAAPGALTEHLPVQAYFCAWEQIPWPELAGRDIAVIGAGASGFDNATWAVDAGCRSVTLIARSPFPGNDLYFGLWRGRDDTPVFADEAGSPPADILEPLLAYNSHLSDPDRLRLFASLFRHGRSPVNPEYLSRVRNLDRIRVLEGWRTERVDYEPGSEKVLVHGNGEELRFDKVVFATGPQSGLSHRPELGHLVDTILTWGDLTGAAGPAPGELAGYPKLTVEFQFQSKDGRSNELGNIYSLADLIHNTVGLQSLQYVVPRIAGHIASSLYQEQLSENISLIDELLES